MNRTSLLYVASASTFCCSYFLLSQEAKSATGSRVVGILPHAYRITWETASLLIFRSTHHWSESFAKGVCLFFNLVAAWSVTQYSPVPSVLEHVWQQGEAHAHDHNSARIFINGAFLLGAIALFSICLYAMISSTNSFVIRQKIENHSVVVSCLYLKSTCYFHGANLPTYVPWFIMGHFLFSWAAWNRIANPVKQVQACFVWSGLILFLACVPSVAEYLKDMSVYKSTLLDALLFFGPLAHLLYHDECKERKQNWACHDCILCPQGKLQEHNTWTGTLSHALGHFYDCITLQALASGNPTKVAFFIGVNGAAMACGTMRLLMRLSENNGVDLKTANSLTESFGVTTVAVFCIAFLGFLADWWLGALKKEKRTEGKRDRTQYFLEWHKRPELMAAFVMGFAGLAYASVKKKQTIPYLVFSVTMTIGYDAFIKKSVASLFGGAKFMASTLPALVILVLYPMSTILEGEALLVGWTPVVQMFIWALAAVLWLSAFDMAFDIPDMKEDKEKGVLTAAVIFGESKTLHLSCAMMLVSAVCSAVAFGLVGETGYNAYTATALLAAGALGMGGVEEASHLYEGLAFLFIFGL